MEERTRDYERSEKEKQFAKICESKNCNWETERFEEYGAGRCRCDRRSKVSLMERC
jgi:hypothetical protein